MSPRTDVAAPARPWRKDPRLNYRERRLLAELARRLQVEDPGLASQLSQPRTPTGLPRWILDLVLVLSILLMPLAFLVGATNSAMLLILTTVAVTLLRLRLRPPRRRQ